MFLILSSAPPSPPPPLCTVRAAHFASRAPCRQARRRGRHCCFQRGTPRITHVIATQVGSAHPLNSASLCRPSAQRCTAADPAPSWWTTPTAQTGRCWEEPRRSGPRRLKKAGPMWPSRCSNRRSTRQAATRPLSASCFALTTRCVPLAPWLGSNKHPFGQFDAPPTFFFCIPPPYRPCRGGKQNTTSTAADLRRRRRSRMEFFF